MSFLQPLLLAALPLIALPIVIHLINQRRFQTTQWAAMMFLLAANRMSRGYARIRQWLILLFRTLAVAGLIFAVSRPLASGWLGLTAGGHPDTTIILLDRSPSMQQRGSGTAASKLATGRQQLVQALETLGSSRWILIESTTNEPHELTSPAAMLELPDAQASGASADLPAMLQAAHDYIRANQAGRTEIWICSDLRVNDWNAASGRWTSLRDSFMEFTQSVRFHLLAYTQPATDNLSVRVTDARRRTTGSGAELAVSLQLTQWGTSALGGEEDAGPATKVASSKRSVPILIEIDGARTELAVEMTGPRYELKDYRITLEGDRKKGWGRVSIPADANPADNDFYFTFDEPPARRSIIVVENPKAARPLQLAASIAPGPELDCEAEVLAIEQLSTVAWEQIALLLWQGPLPTGDTAALVRSFIERGGNVMFLPARNPGDETFLGVQWHDWIQAPKDLTVETWRGDQDLLARTRSGAALPVGRLGISKHCDLSGPITPLATLRGGATLLGRVNTDRGGVYFLTTTPTPEASSLARGGVVLYVAIQRALESGSEVLGTTRQLVAGPPPEDIPRSWRRLAGAEDALSTDYPYHGGVYAAGEQWLAVNRAAAEEQADVLSDARLNQLFRGLDFARVDDQAGNLNSIIHEIWRIFLAAMMVALMVEAGLCLPKPRAAEATP